MEMKCPDRGNIQTFLDLLCVKKEELAACGVTIDKKNYCLTIVKSLLPSLANFASRQLIATCLYSTSKTIDPDLLISIIGEKAECQLAQQSHLERTKSIYHSEGKAAEKETGHNEALVFSDGDSKKKGRKPLRVCSFCWNCGEKKHFYNKYPKPKKIKDSSGEGISSSRGTAANVVDYNSNGAMVFTVTLESGSENSDIVKEICNSEESKECFTKVLNDEDELDVLSHQTAI